MKNQKGAVDLTLVIIAIWVLGVIGWCANVYKLVTCDLQLSEFGIMEIMRIIGIFIAPLGAVLGLF